MTKPIFQIKIEGESVSCLSAQLVDILITLAPYLENLFWFTADIEINGEYPLKLNRHGFKPKKIGGLVNLIDLCKQVDQFMSGVFFAVTHDKKTYEEELSTEDEEFRIISDAVLEIRAFDTTYFEVYTSNLLVVKSLLNRYGGEVSITDNQMHTSKIHLLIPPLVMVDLEEKYNKLKGSQQSFDILRLGKATKLTNLEEN